MERSLMAEFNVFDWGRVRVRTSRTGERGISYGHRAASGTTAGRAAQRSTVVLWKVPDGNVEAFLPRILHVPIFLSLYTAQG